MFDRISRVLLAKAITTIPVYLVVAGAAGSLAWLVTLPVIALYPLLTGLAGWDPLYALAERTKQQREMAFERLREPAYIEGVSAR